LGVTAVLYQYRREVHLTHERVETMMTLCKDQGFTFFLAWGTMLRGWVLAEQGKEVGIAQICQGLTAYQATGSGFFRPYYLGLLDEAYAKGGQTEEGLSVLAEALAVVTKQESVSTRPSCIA